MPTSLSVIHHSPRIRSGPSAFTTRCRTLRQTKNSRRRVRYFGNCLHGFWRAKEPRRTRQIGRPGHGFAFHSRDTLHGPLRDIAFDGGQLEHAVRPEPDAQRVDERRDIDFLGTVDMDAGRLTFGHGFDP